MDLQQRRRRLSHQVRINAMKCVFGFLFAIGILTASATAALAQGTVTDWTVDGSKRQALVFSPKPTTSAIKHPVVFAFHGHGGNMQAASQGMHFQTLWPEAIVVYPQGLPTSTPVDQPGMYPGWQTEAGQHGDRDLKFFDAMLATIRQKFSVDESRIYSTGFSNGGVFSYLLWAARGTIIAAIGECAGRLYPSTHPGDPRSVLAIAGQADTVDPFALQQQSIETARQVDNATGAGQPCGPVCTLFPSTTHTPVMTFIHPGGHVYPPWASQAIVKFFEAHKHP
jgi:polyhydroxybutyrate depolymerase